MSDLYNHELEQSVIGSLMLDNGCFVSVSPEVSEGDFYQPQHRLIYSEIVSMLNASLPVDLVTLTDRMRQSGKLDAVGGFAYVASLALNTPSSSNAATYAKSVRDYSQRRRIVALAQDLAQKAVECDSEDLSQTLTDGMTDILTRATSTSVTFRKAIEMAEKSITEAAKNSDRDGVCGAFTGLPELDRVTGGFHGPRLIIMAARPKCGKSALLNQFAITSAQNGYPGLIISLELGQDELAIRGMSLVSGQNVSKISRGHSGAFYDALEATLALGAIPLWLDAESVSLGDICAQIAAHKYRHGIAWAAVDHIGLVKTEGRFATRNDAMGHVSWSLKQLAKRLKIPIIALSQLSRKSDSEQRKPRPDDLRDSGNLEQDADMVIMLHVNQASRDEPEKEVAIGVPANRTGPSVWIRNKFLFRGADQRFIQLAETWPQS